MSYLIFEKATHKHVTTYVNKKTLDGLNTDKFYWIEESDSYKAKPTKSNFSKEKTNAVKRSLDSSSDSSNILSPQNVALYSSLYASESCGSYSSSSDSSCSSGDSSSSSCDSSC